MRSATKLTSIVIADDDEVTYVDRRGKISASIRMLDAAVPCYLLAMVNLRLRAGHFDCDVVLALIGYVMLANLAIFSLCADVMLTLQSLLTSQMHAGFSPTLAITNPNFESLESSGEALLFGTFPNWDWLADGRASRSSHHYFAVFDVCGCGNF